MILASFLTTAIAPFARLFGWLLAAFYSVSGNYGVAIVLLTVLTMIVVFPLTRKGTRSMLQMQLLQPEMLKLRNKYKKKPGMSAEERREITAKQQEEMMALYRENGVSPTGGCLPMFMQFPVFIVLYNTIRGLTRTAVVGKGKLAHVVSDPEFIDKKTRLYRNLIASRGKMDAFGLNLADSVRSHQLHWVDVIPYVVVILIAVGLQYVSIWQVTNRNPQAGANQQMQQIQRFMPLIFVFIYIEFPAGVGLYFIVSSMFRIGQQEWMYRRDPHILESVRKLREMKAKNPPPVLPAPKGWRERLAALAPQTDPTLEPSEAALRHTNKPIRKPSQGARPTGAKSGQARRNPPGRGGQPGRPGQPKRPAQPGARPAQPGARPAQPGARPAQAGKPGQQRAGLPTRNPQGQVVKGHTPPQGQRPDGASRNGSRPTQPSGDGAAGSGSAAPSSSSASPRRRGRPR